MILQSALVVASIFSFIGLLVNVDDSMMIEKFKKMGYAEREIKEFSKEKWDFLASVKLVDAVSVKTSSNNDVAEVDLNDTGNMKDGDNELATTLSSFQMDDGSYRMMLRSYMTFHSAPTDRKTDIFSMLYDSNVLVSKSGGYPSVESHLMYHHYHYYYFKSRSKPQENEYDKDISEDIVGSDVNKYKLSASEHYVTLKYELPEDYYHYYSNGARKSKTIDRYSDFMVSMEVMFQNTQSSFLSQAFQTVYSHGKSKAKLELDTITISTTAPFVQISGHLTKEDEYETLMNYLVMQVKK